jgi:hypothetical protein
MPLEFKWCATALYTSFSNSLENPVEAETGSYEQFDMFDWSPFLCRDFGIDTVGLYGKLPVHLRSTDFKMNLLFYDLQF